MEQNCNNIVDIHYQQTGEASATNELGMREMQAKAYEARNRRFLLIKTPPASVLVCAHATLRNGMKEISDEEFDDTLLTIGLRIWFIRY